MAKNEWKLEFNDMDSLLAKMRQIPNGVETVLNTEIQGTISTHLRELTQRKLPKSRKVKKHARDSKALQFKYENLGFVMRPTKKFEYLKYPDLAIGTSKNRKAVKALENSLKESIPFIERTFNNAIDKELQRILGGK